MSAAAAETGLAAALAAIVVATLIVIVWGIRVNARKGASRLGDRWGEERVEVVEWSAGEGYVRAGGELWRAKSAEPLSPGDEVSVISTSGLVLDVAIPKTRRAPRAEGE